jgi:hypothetical protein
MKKTKKEKEPIKRGRRRRRKKIRGRIRTTKHNKYLMKKKCTESSFSSSGILVRT